MLDYGPLTRSVLEYCTALAKLLGVTVEDVEAWQLSDEECTFREWQSRSHTE